MDNDDDIPMQTPIQSEEKVRQDREITVDGVVYHEIREVTQIKDRDGTEFMKVVMTKIIGDKVTQTAEIWHNEKSQGLKVISGLNPVESAKFKADWEKNWKPRYNPEANTKL